MRVALKKEMALSIDERGVGVGVGVDHILANMWEEKRLLR